MRYIRVVRTYCWPILAVSSIHLMSDLAAGTQRQFCNKWLLWSNEIYLV